MATVDLDTPEAGAFLSERHLATLTTLRPDGSPHVVPVGFTYADGVVRVITRGGSVKVANVRANGVAVVCSVDGGRYVSIEGRAEVRDDAEEVATAVAHYRERYREPRESPTRVVIVVHPERVLGRV